MEATQRRRLEIGFGLFILAILVLFLVLGLTYPPNPRELPLLVDIAGILIVLIHLVSVIRRPAEPDKTVGATVNWRAVFVSFGSMVVYVIVSYLIGMIVASGVIVYGSGMAFGGKSRLKMGIAAVLTIAVVYLLFVRLLEVELYPGVLFGG